MQWHPLEYLPQCLSFQQTTKGEIKPIVPAVPRVLEKRFRNINAKTTAASSILDERIGSESIDSPQTTTDATLLVELVGRPRTEGHELLKDEDVSCGDDWTDQETIVKGKPISLDSHDISTYRNCRIWYLASFPFSTRYQHR